MRQLLAALGLGLLGLVNAVPSPAAFHPIAVGIDDVDDDLAGSGRELKESSTKLPQRRQALRLRVRSDHDRAVLLRIIHDIPAMVAECIPQCADDPVQAALSLQLVHALYEGRSVTVDTLAARTALSPADVLGRLERLQASGMVLLTAATRGEGTRRARPTPALRRAGDEALERLYYALALTLNER